MIRECQNCGKGVMRGNKVAKARQELNYRSPRLFKPNLHVARVLQEDGTKKKMFYCTKCLRIVKREVAQRIAATK